MVRSALFSRALLAAKCDFRAPLANFGQITFIQVSISKAKMVEVEMQFLQPPMGILSGFALVPSDMGAPFISLTLMATVRFMHTSTAFIRILKLGSAFFKKNIIALTLTSTH